jgi:hypothetical protein
MEINSIFYGTFHYNYIESGYNEQDFNKVYNNSTISIECCLKLPNENGKFVLELDFETPDKKHKGFISSDLKNIVVNGSDDLFLGIHFKEHLFESSKLVLKGDFVLEINEEMDGYHFFHFKLDIENENVLSILIKENLLRLED